MKKDNQKLIDSTDYLVNSASTQDCTGLIPGGLQNEEERKSYEEVYHYLPLKVGKKKTGIKCQGDVLMRTFPWYFI